VLDAFGGTGAVAYLFEHHGARVHYNDALRANALVGCALVENRGVMLAPGEIDALLVPAPGVAYDDFVTRTFAGVFYLDVENHWLDVVAQNVARVVCPYKQALAYYALFQACLAKRPYNIFHRANLAMHTNDVPRSFGNKAAWDRPFDVHFRAFAAQANAAVFDNEWDNVATCADAATLAGDYDLVYLDPPYLRATGAPADYLGYYHFLEGLSEYRDWPSRIDPRWKHRPYRRRPSPRHDHAAVAGAFDALFARFSGSVLAVSYRADGVPSVDRLRKLLRRHRRRVAVHTLAGRAYALAGARTAEVLLVAE
jgi:adenine-specific DNA methylase